jgi:beta-lactamase superfamily II metal-dependent hydrolase
MKEACMRSIVALLGSVALAIVGALALVHAQAPTTAVVNGQVVPVQGPAPTTLDVYYIDTEGGKSVLFVPPSGETLLLDTGTGGDNNRDLERLLAVIKAANLRQNQLDYVIVSHYHGDHSGNLAELAARIPIRRLYDHGPWAVQGSTTPAFAAYVAARERLNASTPKPGTRIPITGLDVTVVSNASELMTKPVAGMRGAGTPNPLCKDFGPRVQDSTPENYEVLGTVIRFGKFTMLDLADLTWNQEKELVCPINLLGTNFDVYNTTRHGTDWAGAPVLVHAARPRIAVMNNGPRKGGTVGTFETLRSSPGFQDVWQLHFSENVPKELNAAEPFIANLESSPTSHPAYFFKLSARRDGSFTMTNQRTGFTKEYPAPKEGARSGSVF